MKISKSVITYIILCYLGSYGIALTLYLTGGMKSPYSGLLILSMIIPAVAAVICRFAFREGFKDLKGFRLPLKYALIALFTIPILKFIFGCLYLVGSGHGIEWASWLSPSSDGLIHPPERAQIGVEPIVPSQLAFLMLDKLVLRFPVLCVLALGEEFGWRSFLQNRLSMQLDAKKAVIVTALISAFWHTGMHSLDSEGMAGLYFVGSAFIAAPLAQMGYSLYFGWLYMRSQSLWVLVLAHASMNKWGSAAFRFLEVPTGDGLLWSELISMIALGTFTLFILSRENQARVTT